MNCNYAFRFSKLLLVIKSVRDVVYLLTAKGWIGVGDNIKRMQISALSADVLVGWERVDRRVNGVFSG